MYPIGLSLLRTEEVSEVGLTSHERYRLTKLPSVDSLVWPAFG